MTDGESSGPGRDKSASEVVLVTGASGFIAAALIARLVEAALGKGRQAAIELLVDRRERRGREGMAAQLFGDRLDLARRNALDIHQIGRASCRERVCQYV